MSADIRPTGIHEPLSAEIRTAMEAAESMDLDMSVDAVLTAATERSGMSDFGASDFEVRLARLLDEVAADDNVWKGVKASFVARCVDHAVMRLRVQRFMLDHPHVDEQSIDRPVIVVGLPRSGTTHLENLVAADRRLRHLPVYLGAEPVPPPGERPTPDGTDPRWLRGEERWQALRSDPVMEAMHEHSPDHACGENELQMPDFASYQWEWIATLPGWRDAYYAEDQTRHFRYAQRLVKAIMVQVPGDERWLLKGNSHSEQLPALMEVYPDATIVMIHRDPVATLQSLLTMRGLPLRYMEKQLDVDRHVRYWVDRVERMLETYHRDMGKVPDGQRIDLRFPDVMADDVSSAGAVLETAGLEVTDDTVSDLAAYMDAHPRGRHGRVAYDMTGDFGVHPKELYERFSPYLERYALEPEVR